MNIFPLFICLYSASIGANIIAGVLDKPEQIDDDKELVEEFKQVLSQIAKPQNNEDQQKTEVKLFSLALQIPSKSRAGIFQKFCASKSGGNDAKTDKEREKDGLECILPKKPRQLFTLNKVKNVAILFDLLLMERHHLLAHLMHKELLQKEAATQTVFKMDIVLEVILASSSEELKKIVNIYSEKYGTNLLNDIGNLTKQVVNKGIKDKKSNLQMSYLEEAKAVSEILSERLEHLDNRTQIGSVDNSTGGPARTTLRSLLVKPLKETIIEIGKLCNKMENKSLENYESEDIEKVYMLVKHILVHFEPDSTESVEMASIWLKECFMITEHVFKDEKQQKYVDEINRMMTVANLMTVNSRTTLYFQHKLRRAVSTGNYAALSELIATRANIDLRDIVEREFGQSDIAQETLEHDGEQRQKQTVNAKSKDGDIEQRAKKKVKDKSIAELSQKNKKDDKRKDNIHTTDALLQNLLAILKSKGYKEKQQLQLSDFGNEYGGTCGVKGPKNLSTLTDAQIAKLTNVLNGPLDRKQQLDIIQKMNKKGGKLVQSWCKEFEKTEEEEMMDKNKQNIEKENGCATKKTSLKAQIEEEKREENLHKEDYFSKKICSMQKEDEKLEFTGLIITFLKLIVDDSELELFNKKIKMSECNIYQKFMNTLLSFKIFNSIRKNQLFVTCTKFIFPSNSKIEKRDILQLDQWYIAHKQLLEQQQHASSFSTNVGQQKHPQKLPKRRRRRKRVVAESTVITVCAVVCVIIYIAVAIICFNIKKKKKKCIFFIFYVIYYIVIEVLGECLGGLLTSLCS